jgi:hypothetical protein
MKLVKGDTERACSLGRRQKIKGVMKGRSLRRKPRKWQGWAMRGLWEI